MNVSETITGLQKRYETDMLILHLLLPVEEILNKNGIETSIRSDTNSCDLDMDSGLHIHAVCGKHVQNYLTLCISIEENKYFSQVFLRPVINMPSTTSTFLEKSSSIMYFDINDEAPQKIMDQINKVKLNK